MGRRYKRMISRHLPMAMLDFESRECRPWRMNGNIAQKPASRISIGLFAYFSYKKIIIVFRELIARKTFPMIPERVFKAAAEGRQNRLALPPPRRYVNIKLI